METAMSIDREEVRRIAELARLEISEDELGRVAGQLSSVLDFMAQLRTLDLAGCEPTAFASPGAPLRPDVPGERGLDAESATAGAPEAEEGYFLVPAVVENLEP